jgi:hypothetical protein
MERSAFVATDRFDALTRSVAIRLSRRTALQAASLGLAAGFAGSRVAAQEGTPGAAPSPDASGGTMFLFVQTAAAGTFTANLDAGTPGAGGTPTPGGGGEYLLTLEGHHGGTVYFSDRPERIFGVAPTQPFLDGLGSSPTNPPNAALVTQTEDGNEDVVVLELLAPTYNEASGTLTYGATILGEYQGDGLTHAATQQQDGALLESFGRASLFIDDCAPATSCMALATVGTFPEWITLGPLPDGPVHKCWHWGDFVCHPCTEQGEENEFITNEYLNQVCNDTYSGCEGECEAS